MDRMEVTEENEEWDPISETDEYEVTRSGRIRNAKTKKELYGTIDCQGKSKSLFDHTRKTMLQNIIQNNC